MQDDKQELTVIYENHFKDSCIKHMNTVQVCKIMHELLSYLNYTGQQFLSGINRHRAYGIISVHATIQVFIED